jgi:hypothetical protein
MRGGDGRSEADWSCSANKDIKIDISVRGVRCNRKMHEE